METTSNPARAICVMKSSRVVASCLWTLRSRSRSTMTRRPCGLSAHGSDDFGDGLAVVDPDFPGLDLDLPLLAQDRADTDHQFQGGQDDGNF